MWIETQTGDVVNLDAMRLIGIQRVDGADLVVALRREGEGAQVIRAFPLGEAGQDGPPLPEAAALLRKIVTGLRDAHQLLDLSPQVAPPSLGRRG